jgi:ubiquinone/menaquinone biosynthesis C-methylase UbiE
MPKLHRDVEPRNLERFLYLLARLPIGGPERKLRWLLNIEWVIEHLCQDYSRRVFWEIEHPKDDGTLDFVSRHLGRGDRVLDVGCGSGYLTSLLAQFGHSARGIDVSEEAVDLARRDYLADNVEFHVADALMLTDKDLEAVNVVFLCHVLGFFEDPQKFLGLLARNVDSVLIEVPDFDSTTLNVFRQRLGLELMFRDQGYVNEFDRDEMRVLLDASRLSVQESEFRHGVQRYWCITESSRSSESSI